MTSILKVDEIQNTDGQSALVITPDGSVSGVKYPEAVAPSGRTITSTTMSSYEEGTWTPVIEGGTTAGTGTYTNQTGSYTRIGNLVSCTGKTVITAHTGTGIMVMADLPFTQNTYQTVGTIMSTNLAYTKDQLALLGSGNSKKLTFFQFGGSTAWATVPMNTSFDVRFQFTYQTNE